jgi:hypothetical protein
VIAIGRWPGEEEYRKVNKSPVQFSIADSMSSSLCNILLIGVDSGELNISGVSVVGPVS